ncbi:isopenicillin N synthase-like dioxygenase [Humitalea rosea]|uniref:2-oxoglutarate-dependent ethylene/succinate-forming enzyme n=1 Tax=Humitalea rosea TaxID=990373 RepID=A0A2W7IU21_9PROT|nr:2OG-Fe(II) oxygenase family protein [Humitalea rosea]PZW42977.1 isopenicillin N synthase-like dioxygenase [Humitalea rosea]
MPNVPSVDFSAGAADPATIAALGATFESCGFVSLRGHGVPPEVIADAFAAAEEFFAAPEAVKRAVQNRANNRGYVPMFDSVRPGEKPSGQEAFSMGHPDRPEEPELRALPFHAETPFPALPGFEARLTTCYRAMFAVGQAVLQAVARHLEVDPGFFDEASAKTYSNMRVVHYPPAEAVAETSDYGVAPHVDEGLITLLIQDMNGGLSVLGPDGAWWPVVPDPEAIVINVGKLLHRWTGGRYAAALHHVVNRSGKERYSMPLFVHPSYHTVIDPMTLAGHRPEGEAFAPIVAGERVLANFKARSKSWAEPQPA